MPRPSFAPPTLGSAWAPTRRSTQRSGDTLTRDAIVKAALELVDRTGVEGLSMRKLATGLGVGVTTLYWHVADKEQMLDLICDEALSEIELPSRRWSWQRQLIALFTSLRSVLLRHRDLASLLTQRANVGPHGLRAREAVVASLRAAGLDDTRLGDADQTLFSYVIGFVANETAGWAPPPDHDVAIAAKESIETSYLAQLSPTEFPNLVAMATARRDGRSLDERFTFGITCLVKGIEAGL